MDRTVIVLFAFLLSALFGGPRRWYEAAGLLHVAHLPARAIWQLERKLNRETRSVPDREFRGQVVMALFIVLSLLLGFLASWTLQGNLRFIEIVLVAAMLPVRPLWDRVTALRKALAASKLQEARDTLTGTVWKHHPRMDEHALARAAIEILAVDFSEKIICPVIGYLLFGLPGLFVCKAVTLLRDALVHAPEFGKAARGAHTLLHALPARLSALLWLLAALFLPAKNQPANRQLWNAFMQDEPRALCLHAASSTGHVSLGGPGSPYSVSSTRHGTIKVLTSDIRRAQANYLLAVVLFFVWLGAFF